ncbi:MAG: Glyoxalase family protein [uncultured Chloroflexia bacterium]|uniref:Glyoxalase family protein n=1 Tax=uncultured Chloroflexia bacterium TaxID=1672391 RepID=A0A6J4K3J0_9CHLR|nr:MAG: Glyoxalase family protein [uncultured Chloroflexia bacterium]
MDIPPIKGIHHITLVAADARRTADFYTRVLGLKLVKKTVNFDAPDSYHLYFGDEIGTPGTLVTFFEWPRAPKGHWGIGATHHFALIVENNAGLLRWKRRLTDQGIAVDGPYNRVYFESIYFTDPDGVIVEIATRGPGWGVDEPFEAWGTQVKPPPLETTIGHRDEAAIAARTWPEPVTEIDAEMRIPGIHHITAMASDIERTTHFYTAILGMRLVKRTLNFDNPEAPHLYYTVEDGHPGSVITYFGYDATRMRCGQIGRGLTHHFALEVENDAAQQAWRERLLSAGIRTTPVLDRSYFHSIYFNDPDGHIVEIATRNPGFLIDESRETLGRRLSLPPWLETERRGIEAGLKPVES